MRVINTRRLSAQQWAKNLTCSPFCICFLFFFGCIAGSDSSIPLTVYACRCCSRSASSNYTMLTPKSGDASLEIAHFSHTCSSHVPELSRLFDRIVCLPLQEHSPERQDRQRFLSRMAGLFVRAGRISERTTSTHLFCA